MLIIFFYFQQSKNIIYVGCYKIDSTEIGYKIQFFMMNKNIENSHSLLLAYCYF
jgi:hypothetical protein